MMKVSAPSVLPKSLKLFDLQQNTLGDALAADIESALMESNPDMMINVEYNSGVPHNIYGLNVEDIIPGSEADINTTYSD